MYFLWTAACAVPTASSTIRRSRRGRSARLARLRRTLPRDGVQVVMGVVQMLSVAAILPLMFVLQHPGVIETNAYLSRAYAGLGFASHQGFMLALASGVFLLVVFGMAFKAATSYATYRFATMRSYTISSRMLNGYLSQPYTWFLDRNSAGLGASVLGEVQKVVSMALLPAMKFVTALVLAVSLITLLVVVRPESVRLLQLAGRMSYSIYLWHVILQARILTSGPFDPPSPLVPYLTALLVVSAITYRWIEFGYVRDWRPLFLLPPATDHPSVSGSRSD